LIVASAGLSFHLLNQLTLVSCHGYHPIPHL
jgi:hypothetical protein